MRLAGKTARFEAGLREGSVLVLALVSTSLLATVPLAGSAAASAGTSGVASEIAYATTAGAIGIVG